MSNVTGLYVYEPLALALKKGQLRHVRNLRRIDREMQQKGLENTESLKARLEKALNGHLTDEEVALISSL